MSKIKIMEKILEFKDIKSFDLDKIGAGHQFLGITNKGQYVLGKSVKCRDGRVYISNMYYVKQVAILN